MVIFVTLYAAFLKFTQNPRIFPDLSKTPKISATRPATAAFPFCGGSPHRIRNTGIRPGNKKKASENFSPMPCCICLLKN